MLAKSLCCGLVILLISTKAAAQNITSIDSYCLNLLRGNESVLIGPGERISGETINSKFKGKIDSIISDRLFIDGASILIDEVNSIKFLPTEKRKVRNAFLLSSPISFASAVGFGFWYLGSGGEWTNLTGIGMLIYAPIGIMIGTILSKKNKFIIIDGWEFKIILTQNFE